MGPAPTLGRIRRALLRCPNWLGDTVMAIPAVRALRDGFPGVELWCVGPWVDAVLEAEPGIGRRLVAPRAWRGRLNLVRELRAAALDLVVLLPNSFEAAVFGWLTGAPWRIGYAGEGRGIFLTHALSPGRAPAHQVAAYLALLAPLGVAASGLIPTLQLAAARRAEAGRLLAEIGVQPGDSTVAIQLGAAFGPAKLWPAERLAALATRLERQGMRVVFLGDRAAAPLLRTVEARLGTVARHLVGRDHPAVLPALLAEFAVVVAPDSGPAHVAAAVGVPVVALFGPTDPRLTAPLGEGHVAVWRKPSCAPCFRPTCPIDHRCMTGITVDEVAAAVLARHTGRLPRRSEPDPP